MEALIDYLRWRGDLEFRQDPFNEVDNLVYSCLSYIDFSKVFEKTDDKVMSLMNVLSLYYEEDDNTLENIRKINSSAQEADILFRIVGRLKRYKYTYVRNFVNLVDENKTLQFSAVEYLLTDGTSYIVFRGTDNSIVGWKEDLLMTSIEVESEKEAVLYLDRVGSKSNRRLRVGGHSKGGHLAVYASANCYKDVRDRIIKIYNNDGPGFSDDFVKSEKAERISARVTNIVPEESIVGMLMEPVGDRIVVKSVNKNLTQHFLSGWEVQGKNLIRIPDISKNARNINNALRKWLNEFSEAELGRFVCDLFSVFEAPGVKTFSELQSDIVKYIPIMLKQANNLNPATKEKIISVIKGLFYGLIS